MHPRHLIVLLGLALTGCATPPASPTAKRRLRRVVTSAATARP